MSAEPIFTHRSTSRRRQRLFGFGLLLALSLACKREPKPSERSAQETLGNSLSSTIALIDVHVHLAPTGVERLLEIMQQRNVAHVVNLSGGDTASGLEAQLAAARAAPGKITVFATMPYAETRAPGYGQRMARNLRAAHALGARGYKIAKALGLGMRDSMGQLIAVDDPDLDVVFNAAGELGIPVAIHSGDPLRFWDPPTPDNERYRELRAHPGWSLYGRAVPAFDELYAALERRFARHPKTTFISVHFGNLAEDPARVAQTLRKYPNVYIDTAARIGEMGRHDPAAMRAFFDEFQDRILFGSDLGVGPEPSPLFLGSSGASPPTAEETELFFSATRRYFETNDVNFAHPTPIQGDWRISGIGLPEAILRKVFQDNAKRLLQLD